MKNYWQKIGLFIGISIVLIFGMFIFLTKPAINSYTKNKKDYLDKQDALLSTFDKIEILQKDSKTSASSTRKIEEVMSLWPDDPNVSKFMVQTEDLAKKSNFVMENFSISEKKIAKASTASADTSSDSGDAKASTKYTTVTQYSFSTTVPFPTALDIIKSMERLPRYNSVSSLTLTAKDDQTLDLSLTGRLYYGK